MKIHSWLIKTLSILAVTTIIFGLLPAGRVSAASTTLSLDDFSAALSNGQPSTLVGVFVEDLLALRVVHQASAAYVSPIAGTATLFDLATQFNSIGLLAHNYLSGAYFAKLELGDQIHLVYGDGAVLQFEVTDIRQYQALSPNDPYSNFKNLDDQDQTISSTDLFKETYGESGNLILQTCISQNGISSWGRLFVIATPVS